MDIFEQQKKLAELQKQAKSLSNDIQRQQNCCKHDWVIGSELREDFEFYEDGYEMKGIDRMPHLASRKITKHVDIRTCKKCGKKQDAYGRVPTGATKPVFPGD